MAQRLKVLFNHPFVSVKATTPSKRLYTEAEVSAIRTASRDEGGEIARSFANQQLVEFRAEVQALQQGLFEKLAQVEPDLLEQLRATLPQLAIEISRRLLAGYEPSADQVRALCEDTIAQIYPEKEQLEVLLSPRDSALLDEVSGDWKSKYPGLRVNTDPTLGPGDCQVRSRFGLADARRSVKLETLSRELLSA